MCGGQMIDLSTITVMYRWSLDIQITALIMTQELVNFQPKTIVWMYGINNKFWLTAKKMPEANKGKSERLRLQPIHYFGDSSISSYESLGYFVSLITLTTWIV